MRTQASHRFPKSKPGRLRARQAQATLASRPCKPKRRGESRRMPKWDYFPVGATSTNPPAFAEAIRSSWASLQTKPRASQLGQPALESFSFTFQYIRRGREEHPRVPIFHEMLQLPGHILTFKIFAGKVMRIWKQHVFLGELIWPIRQGIICLSKSVHESLFQIKRNIIFLGPSKSNTTFMFFRSLHKHRVTWDTAWIISNSHVNQYLYHELWTWPIPWLVFLLFFLF